MIKVAVYCRVSTGKEDQANSFESQKRFFENYVSRRHDWELYEVYADQGVSGTTTKKRVAFQRMLNDALEGKFQLIITKSVDRFARNTQDTINITYDLKAANVNILFVTNKIDTREPDFERNLVSAAMAAQEESSFNSERITWGQQYQMEQGVVFGHSMLGYDVKNGKMSINPEGAEIVQLIFQKYGLEKKGTSVIARELREAGYRTLTGNYKWDNSYIMKILTNEKYMGDLVQRKTVTEDYRSHKKVYNYDESILIKKEDHHEPIIDRDLWDIVQAEIQKRDVHGEQGAGHSNRYPFSGKIKCGECGSSFTGRRKYLKDGSSYRRWRCFKAESEGTTHIDIQGNKMGCNIGKTIRDDLAVDMLRMALQSIPMDTEQIIQNVASLAIDAIRDSEERNPDVAWKLENEIDAITEKKKKVLDTYFSDKISEENMRMMCDKYDNDLAELQERLKAVNEKEKAGDTTNQRQDEIKKQLADIISCNPNSFVFAQNVLDKMVVYQDNHVDLTLNNLPQKWIFDLTLQRKNAKEKGDPRKAEPALSVNTDQSCT